MTNKEKARSSSDAPRLIKSQAGDYTFLSGKNRALFSLSFCLDTTASSAQVQKNEKIKALNFSFSALADAYSYFKTTYNSLRPPRRKFLLLSETDIFEKCSCRNFKN
jgi:hypothetical protein